MRVLIVGGGKMLFFLCRAFTEKGHEVIIINRSREECVHLSRQLSATVVFGDGSDLVILKEAGAMGADVVLAITPHDQDNLIICQLASIQFHVPRSIALANDPDNVGIFEKLGVSAFSTTHIVSRLIEQRASLEQIVNLLPIGEGRVNVTELVLPAYSPVVGKPLKKIGLPENVLVAVVMRDLHPIVPRGDDILLPGDRIVLITLTEHHENAVKAFLGSGN